MHCTGFSKAGLSPSRSTTGHAASGALYEGLSTAARPYGLTSHPVPRQAFFRLQDYDKMTRKSDALEKWKRLFECHISERMKNNQKLKEK